MQLDCVVKVFPVAVKPRISLGKKKKKKRLLLSKYRITAVGLQSRSFNRLPQEWDYCIMGSVSGKGLLNLHLKHKAGFTCSNSGVSMLDVQVRTRYI